VYCRTLAQATGSLARAEASARQIQKHTEAELRQWGELHTGGAAGTLLGERA
jgi:hypothetical protein